MTIRHEKLDVAHQSVLTVNMLQAQIGYSTRVDFKFSILVVAFFAKRNFRTQVVIKASQQNALSSSWICPDVDERGIFETCVNKENNASRQYEAWKRNVKVDKCLMCVTIIRTNETSKGLPWVLSYCELGRTLFIGTKFID